MLSADQFCVLVLTEDGKVLSEDLPVEGLPENEIYVSVHSATMHSAALTDRGILYVWGRHVGVFVGDGAAYCDTTKHAPICVPSHVFGGMRVTKVALGDMNTCVVANGCLFTGGWRIGGRLGYSVTDEMSAGDMLVGMKHVPIQDECSAAVSVVDVATGSNSSGIVGLDGSVWTWGLNGFGECGLGDNAVCREPTRVTTVGAECDMAFNAAQIEMHSHTVVVASDGRVNVWGRNDTGQLGLDDLRMRPSPTHLECVPMRSAACGYAHTLLLTTNGDIWGCGSNIFGECGTGECEEVRTPTRVDGVSSVVYMSAGLGQSVAATIDGEMFQWGVSRKNDFDAVYWPCVLEIPSDYTHTHTPELFTLQTRVGLDHRMPQEMELALAMCTHARLGDKSPLHVLCTDIIQRVAEAWVVRPRL